MGIFASVFTKVAFDQGGRMMSKLVCDQCGTTFNCGSTPDRSCWCMNLPNMRGSYDLAGKCVCPDCLTLGKAKEITKQRKKRNIVRQQNSIR